MSRAPPQFVLVLSVNVVPVTVRDPVIARIAPPWPATASFWSNVPPVTSIELLLKYAPPPRLATLSLTSQSVKLGLPASQ